jgi:hypothetical protein
MTKCADTWLCRRAIADRAAQATALDGFGHNALPNDLLRGIRSATARFCGSTAEPAINDQRRPVSARAITMR